MAKEENKIVDRLFEGRLKDATVAPPAGLWDGIAADLENDRLRKKVAMWRWVAAATILLFLGFGSWTIVHFSSVDHSEELMALQHSDGNLAVASADRSHSQNAIVSKLIEPDCSDQSYDQASSSKFADAGVRSSGPLRAIRNAVNNAPREELRGIRKSSGIPAMLTALNSRSTHRMNPSEAFSHPEKRDIASIPAPTWIVDADNIATEIAPESKRTKRRDREILAWNAGDKKERNEKKMQWALGGSFSPDVAFDTEIPVGDPMAKTAGPALPDDPANSPRLLSAPVATFSTGLRAAVDVNDRIAVRSGLLYTRRSGSQTELAKTFGKQESYANNFSVDFLEVPVSVQYNVVNGKVFDYYVSTGVSGNVMLGFKQELQTSNGNITSKNISDKSEAFAPAQASLLMSTGMQYRAFEHLSINLEPGVRYGFLTSQYAFSRQDPLSFSLVSSVNFHF